MGKIVRDASQCGGAARRVVILNDKNHSWRPRLIHPVKIEKDIRKHHRQWSLAGEGGKSETVTVPPGKGLDAFGCGDTCERADSLRGRIIKGIDSECPLAASIDQ